MRHFQAGGRNGPNGSGKSSFFDGLEYALLGNIEEAQSKRYNAADYSRNVQKGYSTQPKVYTINTASQKEEIAPNINFYRFSFIEKNRIDGFSRIAATTEAVQKDRIATLFGLDAFNDFVNGFTDVLDNRYLPLINEKETEFDETKQVNEQALNRLKSIETELAIENDKVKILIEEIGNQDLTDLATLRNYLVGEDGLSGIIGDLQKKRSENVGEAIKETHIDDFLSTINAIKETRIDLGIKIVDL